MFVLRHLAPTVFVDGFLVENISKVVIPLGHIPPSTTPQAKMRTCRGFRFHIVVRVLLFMFFSFAFARWSLCVLVCNWTAAALRPPIYLKDATGFALDAELDYTLPERARNDFVNLFHRNDADPGAAKFLRRKDLKIVLGIAVAPQHTDDRNLHRDTWFRSPLVCQGEFRTPQGCAVLPRFILEEGSLPPKTDPMHSRLQKEQEEHHDLAFLPRVLAEKTRQWLADAVRMYPEAKYIGKLDADTYVSPANLIEDLIENERSYQIDYFGLFLDGWSGGFVSEGEECDTSTECCSPPSNCTTDEGFSDGCWVYAHGGFYLVSQTVAKHVSKLLDERHPSAMKYACEDAILGKWIQSAPSKEAVWGSGSSHCNRECWESQKLSWYHMYYSEKGVWDGHRGKGF